MFIRVEKRAPRYSVHIVWGGIAVFLIAGARALRGLLPHVPACIFHELTGVPCMTCGGTRSLAALGQFHVAASFMFNPLVMLAVLAAIAFSATVSIGFLLRRSLLVALSDSEKNVLRITVLVLATLNWVFLILREKL